MPRVAQLVVLSLDRALSPPYDTVRSIHLGRRVIYIDSTPLEVDVFCTNTMPSRHIVIAR